MNTEITQIAKIDQAIPELEYDGTEGYVIERGGEFIAQAATFAGARQLVSGSVFTRDDAADYWGRQTWTARA